MFGGIITEPQRLVAIGGVTACKLTKGGTPSEEVTCTEADTDYAVSGAMPSDTKYVVVGCDESCKVAMGEATSATVGAYVGPGAGPIFAVTPTGTEADDKPHVQSATAGAKVRFTYMKDA